MSDFVNENNNNINDNYGYTNREIAKVLHISESNVGSRLYRTKQALKKKMEGGYGE